MKVLQNAARPSNGHETLQALSSSRQGTNVFSFLGKELCQHLLLVQRAGLTKKNRQVQFLV